MKAIIFGINGQDGYFLKDILEKENISVVGVSRSEGNWIKGSVSNYEFVCALIQEHQPAFVFHLAANSTTRHDAIFENHETICTGTLNILEGVKLFSPSTKVFISGSGLQFKNTGQPISEHDPFEARDAYSVSRIHSVYASRYYRSIGLKVYVGYFFNHDSFLRTERHVNQKIVTAVKRIAEGSSEIIELGSIETKKEFTFAGDTVSAIWLLVNNNTVFEAVIGSGKAYSIKDWIILCFGYFGLDWKKHIRTTPGFKTEYDILVSNPGTILSLGWKQTTSIEMLSKLMIEHDGK